MKLGLVEEALEVAGVKFTASLPGLRCTSCDETLLGAAELGRFELRVAEELVALGRRTGSALRFVRHALGYKAADLAEVLDVAPETLSRWETGEREPDAARFALLGALAEARLLGSDARLLAMLRAMREPGAVPKGPRRIDTKAYAASGAR